MFESIRTTEAIFVGRVVASTPLVEGQDFDDLTRTEFEVLERFQGLAMNEQPIVLANPNDGLCGKNLVLGETYLVYGTNREDGHLTTFTCDRTSLLHSGTDDLSFLRLLDRPMGLSWARNLSQHELVVRNAFDVPLEVEHSEDLRTWSVLKRVLPDSNHYAIPLESLALAANKYYRLRRLKTQQGIVGIRFANLDLSDATLENSGMSMRVRTLVSDRPNTFRLDRNLVLSKPWSRSDTLGVSLIDDLDQGQFPIDFSHGFPGGGFRLASSSPTVTVIEPGNEWLLIGEDTLELYHLKRERSSIRVRSLFVYRLPLHPGPYEISTPEGLPKKVEVVPGKWRFEFLEASRAQE